jgi:hypothetical protein
VGREHIVKMVGNIPPWFNEGLAVVVSHGAGAEEYSDSAAIDWINKGRCIKPNGKGNFLKPSNDTQLPWDMFYQQQSSLFVEFLEKSNPVAFQSVLKDIENKAVYQKSFDNNFKKSIKEEFAIFKAGLKVTEKANKAS